MQGGPSVHIPFLLETKRLGKVDIRKNLRSRYSSCKLSNRTSHSLPTGNEVSSDSFIEIDLNFKVISRTHLFLLSRCLPVIVSFNNEVLTFVSSEVRNEVYASTISCRFYTMHKMVLLVLVPLPPMPHSLGRRNRQLSFLKEDQ